MADITGTIPSNGELQGVISTASLIAGNVVGVIGPKGEKGDPGEKGDTGDTGAAGNGISSAILNSDYTLTLNFTDGTSYTTTAIRGEKGDTGDTGLKGDTGDTGNGIASIAKTGTQGLVDTYTITFTNGTTTTFTVTNGQNGSGSVADVWVNNVSVLDGYTAKVIVPTKVSDLTNDSGFITGYTETDPTVPAWAKQSTKPSYTASEVGALPDTTSIPSKTSDLTNDSDFVSGDVIADEYSASSTYAVGDYCVYNGQLYRCITAISTAEAWTAAHWTAVTVAEELTDLKGDIPQAVSELTNDAGYITGYTETDPVYSASAASGINSSDITNWNSKQAALVSGTNIKTINSTSLLGSGDIAVATKSSLTVTISVADWSSTTTCTKSVTGVTASNDVIVTPAPASIADWQGSGVYCSAQGSGTLTFICSSTPTASIDVNVLIIS